MQGNYVPDSDAVVMSQRAEYDVIMCLNVTRWVQLNWGDGGLQRLFRRVYTHLTPGGVFILQPQPWSSYSKRKRLTVNCVCVCVLHSCQRLYIHRTRSKHTQRFHIRSVWQDRDPSIMCSPPKKEKMGRFLLQSTKNSPSNNVKHFSSNIQSTDLQVTIK